MNQEEDNTKENRKENRFTLKKEYLKKHKQ